MAPAQPRKHLTPGRYAIVMGLFRGNGAGGLQWAGATPALFLPIIGNVLVPLAGVLLGYPEWSAAQLGVGLMFWPVVLGLIVTRIAVNGLWPERLLPAALALGTLRGLRDGTLLAPEPVAMLAPATA